jgi:hypothetical protein
VKLGAVGGVNYTEDGWGKAAGKVAGGSFDIVIDSAGGDGVGECVKRLGIVFLLFAMLLLCVYCVVLCCAVLCCAVLCCAVLCYAMLLLI